MDLEEIAKNNMIFKTITGSHMYGLAGPNSDRDEVGVFIPPKDFVLGIHKVDQVEIRTNSTSSGHRNKPQSNEIYDPKTVISKLDLQTASRNAIPVIFDLKTREAIWVDLATKGVPKSWHYRGWGRSCNNVESNRASIKQILKAVTSLNNKPILYDLFMTHAVSRGDIVENKDEADIVFGLDGDITPKDINIINSEYIT